VALLAGATIVAISATSASAGEGTSAPGRGQSEAHPPKQKPTVVLVHGAWADSGSWAEVVARLQRDGYPVSVFPTPLQSLAGDSAALRDFLGAITGPVFLVGLSYGGAVVTDAATGNANVRALVYLDAFAPAAGHPVLGYVDPSSFVARDPNEIFTIIGATAQVYIKPGLFPGAFANDLPAARATVLAASQRPIAFGALTELSTSPAWATIPSWYEVGTLDKVIPSAAQTAMATAAGAHIVTARTGHLPMMSQPETVVRTIETAAIATN
jgi:pimeloyl-ACP methyl ester carboxylesterase